MEVVFLVFFYGATTLATTRSGHGCIGDSIGDSMLGIVIGASQSRILFAPTAHPLDGGDVTSIRGKDGKEAGVHRGVDDPSVLRIFRIFQIFAIAAISSISIGVATTVATAANTTTANANNMTLAIPTNQNGTSAASALATSQLGTRQSDVASQKVQQSLIRTGAFRERRREEGAVDVKDGRGPISLGAVLSLLLLEAEGVEGAVVIVVVVIVLVFVG
mmetsp:Transcript_19331/g.40518  ORF Transcript_19331/g.40518 Transcript_19331/m.40518 type:complete len:218 (+) Transcript_19331:4511-5164(+)